LALDNTVIVTGGSRGIGANEREVVDIDLAAGK
jgi:hypothetical protein